MKKIFVTAGAVVVVLLAAIVGLQQLGISNNPNKSLLSFGTDVRVSRAADGAFGNLATLSVAAGRGGGGSNAALASDSSSPAYGMGGDAVAEKMMIAPSYEPINYKYVYRGEELKLETTKLDVLKKQNPDAGQLAASLSSLGMGLVNLDSFSGTKVQSVSFNQDNGYNIYVDLMSGSVSISGYYDIAAMDSHMACTKEAGCPQPEPLNESDIPADDRLISIANQFLAEHGISTAAYGNPEVRNEYRAQILAQLEANPKSLIYWPEYIEVVYPLRIEGEEVFDESGQKMGLTVGVSIRSNKVTSVWNLSTQNYQASSYDAETDNGKILKIAEQGGLYGYYGEVGGKTVEIELGTPTLQYVSMWDYQMNSSQQVLVPSLVFPVTLQPDDGSFYRKAVVVPLIKDILDRSNGIGGGGPIRIMEDAVPPAPATK